MQHLPTPESTGITLTRKGQRYCATHQVDRVAIEAAIDRLIDLLDELDGDPDLEPYLAGDLNMRMGAIGDDREGDDADNEPSLGWPCDDHGGANQASATWYAGNDDREGDPGDLGIADSGALDDYRQQEAVIAAFGRQRQQPRRWPYGAVVITGPDGGALARHPGRPRWWGARS